MRFLALLALISIFLTITELVNLFLEKLAFQSEVTQDRNRKKRYPRLWYDHEDLETSALNFGTSSGNFSE